MGFQDESACAKCCPNLTMKQRYQIKNFAQLESTHRLTQDYRIFSTFILWFCIVNNRNVYFIFGNYIG
jgi:hypothetical protein